jgi:hypothetical protein
MRLVAGQPVDVGYAFRLDTSPAKNRNRRA